MINEPITDWKKWKYKCIICHKDINVNKEKYVKLIDMEGRKEISYVIYHLNCWQNRFTVTQEVIQKTANDWMSKISNSLGGKQTIEF